jgi:hypothetical protein
VFDVKLRNPRAHSHGRANEQSWYKEAAILEYRFVSFMQFLPNPHGGGKSLELHLNTESSEGLQDHAMFLLVPVARQSFSGIRKSNAVCLNEK